MHRLITVLCMALLTFGSAASAQQSSLGPEVPKALFELETPHPADILENHMNYLKHDRDSTVQLGDRNIEFSLKSCVACHAVRGPDTNFVTNESDAYFCRVCHEYVAVSIDCFTCHNSLPDLFDFTGLYAPDDTETLAAYVEEISQ